MRVVEEMLYRKIKFVGHFEPNYATIIEPAQEPDLPHGCVYIKRVDGWFCVFKKTRDGKIRRGGYKNVIDAVYAAHLKR